MYNKIREMKIDYQLEYRKQLQRNISLVRSEIDNTDFVLKITNHANCKGLFRKKILNY